MAQQCHGPGGQHGLCQGQAVGDGQKVKQRNVLEDLWITHKKSRVGNLNMQGDIIRIGQKMKISEFYCVHIRFVT